MQERNAYRFLCSKAQSSLVVVLPKKKKKSTHAHSLTRSLTHSLTYRPGLCGRIYFGLSAAADKDADGGNEGDQKGAATSHRNNDARREAHGAGTVPLGEQQKEKEECEGRR
jgi:hypothetical protein